MATSSTGLFGSVRNLLIHGLELARVRLELLAVELAEEKNRLLKLLAYGAVAFLMLGAGIVFLAMFLTVLLWEEHRLLALGLLTSFFLGSGFVALAMAWQGVKSRSGFLAATLGELSQDQAALKASDRAAKEAGS